MRCSLRKTVYYLVAVNVAFLLFCTYTVNYHTIRTTYVNVDKVIVTSLLTTTPYINQSTTVPNKVRHSGLCPELRLPAFVKPSETWFRVGGGVKNYVFSAYYDDISDPHIRILGLTERKTIQVLFCQLWYNDTTDLQIVTATVKKIPEDHMKRYSAAMYLCAVNQKDNIPYAVSLVGARCEKATNVLSVDHSSTKKWELSLCLTPLNFKYSRAFEMVEMIELNRLLGVEHFVFYNQSIGSNVDSILKKYIDEGVVTVVQWTLPVKVDSWPQNKLQEVHYFAQLVALNDCLYRNLHRSKYVVFTDLDEFVIPRQNTNLTSLVNNSDTSAKKYGAFVFQCVFFRKDWPKYTDDFQGRSLAEKYQSITLFNLMRETKIWPLFSRSKYIIKPIGVEVTGIHTIWRFRPGYSTYKTNSDIARLHHYRSWENPGDRVPRQTDMIIREHFADRLTKQLDQRWQTLPNVPLDISINNYTFPLR